MLMTRMVIFTDVNFHNLQMDIWCGFGGSGLNHRLTASNINDFVFSQPKKSYEEIHRVGPNMHQGQAGWPGFWPTAYTYAVIITQNRSSLFM